jgi:predicted kinase
MGELVRENLQQGNNVIYDGNLLSNNERFEMFNRFKNYGKVVFLALAIDFTYSLNGRPAQTEARNA